MGKFIFRFRKEKLKDILDDERVVIQYETGNNSPVLVRLSRKDREAARSIRDFINTVASTILIEARKRKYDRKKDRY